MVERCLRNMRRNRVGECVVDKEAVREAYDELVDEMNGVFFEKYLEDRANGLLMKDDGGGYVEICEWNDLHGLGFEKQIEEGTPVLKICAVVPIERLIDPTEPHRGTYAGDVGGAEVTSENIKDAGIAYLAYWGGEESFVEEAGD